MNVLAIDTSTSVLSVALLQEGKVLAEYTTQLKKTHSVQALPAVQRLLEQCGLVAADLSRIVVAKGPGSYTGVRIGVTIAKTLAWSLGTQLVGISSLEALAQNGKWKEGYLVPIIDARRGQVFTALFRAEHGVVERCSEDQILDCREWVQQLQALNEPVHVVGIDIAIHQEAFMDGLQKRVTFATAADCFPRASQLGLLGIERPSEDCHHFVPNYARIAEAEANWLKASEQV